MGVSERAQPRPFSCGLAPIQPSPASGGRLFLAAAAVFALPYSLVHSAPVETKLASAAPPPDLLDPVVAYFRPRRVIAFGSHARGAAGPDSDYDLLVVVDDDTPPSKVTLAAGFEARRGYRKPADVVPIRESTFRRRARIPGTLCYAAAREGVVVYERP